MLAFELIVKSDADAVAYRQTLADLVGDRDINCSVSVAGSQYLRLPAVRAGRNYYEGDYAVQRFLSDVVTPRGFVDNR